MVNAMFKDPVDSLLKEAKKHPNTIIREKLIDLEVDYNGVWVGFSAANYIWHRAIPGTVSAIQN